MKFENPVHASILKAVLDANPELKPSIIAREIFVLDDGLLRMYEYSIRGANLCAF